MADTLKINDELIRISDEIKDAATLLDDGIKIYQNAFNSFLGMYLGDAQNDERELAEQFIKSLTTLYEFYGQASYYVTYCLKYMKETDDEEAKSYNLDDTV